MINSCFLFLTVSCLILNLSFAQEFSKEETKWLAQPEFLIPVPKNNHVTKEEADSFRVSIDVLLDANSKDEDRQLARTRLSNERAGKEIIDALKAMVNKKDFQKDPRRNLILRQLFFFINQDVLQTKNRENTLYLTQVYFELYVKGIVNDERLETIPKKYLVEEYSKFKYRATEPEEKLRLDQLTTKIKNINETIASYNLSLNFHYGLNVYGKINSYKEYFEQTNPETQKIEVMDRFFELYDLSYKMIEVKTNEGKASEFKTAPVIFRDAFFSFPKKTLEKFYFLNPHLGAIELEKALAKSDYGSFTEIATKFFYSYAGNMAAYYSALNDINSQNWLLAMAKVEFCLGNLHFIRKNVTDDKKIRAYTELETNFNLLGAFISLKLSDEEKFQLYVKALNNPKLNNDFFREIVGKNIPTSHQIIQRYVENSKEASGVANIFFALSFNRNLIVNHFAHRQDTLKQNIKKKLSISWVDLSTPVVLENFVTQLIEPSQFPELLPIEYAFGPLNRLTVSDLFDDGALVKAYVAGLRKDPETMLSRLAKAPWTNSQLLYLPSVLEDIYTLLAKGPLDDLNQSNLAAIGAKIVNDNVTKEIFLKSLHDKRDTAKIGALKIIVISYGASHFGAPNIIHLLEDPNEEIRGLAARSFYHPYPIPFSKDQLTKVQKLFKSEKSLSVRIELMRVLMSWNEWPKTDVQIIQEALKSKDEVIVDKILSFISVDYFFDKKLFEEQMAPYVQSKNGKFKIISTLALISLAKKQPAADLVKSLCESYSTLFISDNTRTLKYALEGLFYSFDLETHKLAAKNFVEIYKNSSEDAVKIETLKGLNLLPKEALADYEQFIMDLSKTKDADKLQYSAAILSTLGSKAKLFLASLEKAKDLDDFQLGVIARFQDAAVIPLLKKWLPNYSKEVKAKLFKSVSTMCVRQPLALDFVFHALDDVELKEAALTFLSKSGISISVFEVGVQAKYIEKLKKLSALSDEFTPQAQQALKVVAQY